MVLPSGLQMFILWFVLTCMYLQNLPIVLVIVIKVPILCQHNSHQKMSLICQHNLPTANLLYLFTASTMRTLMETPTTRVSRNVTITEMVIATPVEKGFTVFINKKNRAVKQVWYDIIIYTYVESYTIVIALIVAYTCTSTVLLEYFAGEKLCEWAKSAENLTLCDRVLARIVCIY